MVVVVEEEEDVGCLGRACDLAGGFRLFAMRNATSKEKVPSLKLAH